MEEWRDQAACIGVEPNVMFPTTGKRGGHPNTRPTIDEVMAEAKALCARCPVQSDCLDYALANHISFGVWGGLSSRERTKLARERRWKVEVDA